MRDLYGTDLEALKWWANQTKEERHWVRKVKKKSDWRKVVARQRLKWKEAGVVTLPERHKPKINPEGSEGDGSSDGDTKDAAPNESSDESSSDSDEPLAKRRTQRMEKEKATREEAEKRKTSQTIIGAAHAGRERQF